jgi:hypothetical protein
MADVSSVNIDISVYNFCSNNFAYNIGCINCVALGDAKMHTAPSSGDCNSCNNNVITKEVELSQEQLSWINGQTVDGKGTIEQDVINACMSIDEYTVFGIIRCKSSVAKCEGAQEAVENIQQQFGIKEKNEVITKENIDICAKDCGCE